MKTILLSGGVLLVGLALAAPVEAGRGGHSGSGGGRPASFHAAARPAATIRTPARSSAFRPGTPVKSSSAGKGGLGSRVKLPAAGVRKPSGLASKAKRPQAKRTKVGKGPSKAGKGPIRLAKAGKTGGVGRKGRTEQVKRSLSRNFRGFRHRWYSRHHHRHFYYSASHRSWFYWSHKKGSYLSTGYLNSDPPDGDEEDEPEVAGGEPPDLPEDSAVEPPDVYPEEAQASEPERARVRLPAAKKCPACTRR